MIGVSLVLNQPRFTARSAATRTRRRPRAGRALAAAPRLSAAARLRCAPRPARRPPRAQRRRASSAAPRRSRTPRRCCARSSSRAIDARRAARRDRDRHPAARRRTSRASGRTRCSPRYLGLGLALRLWRERVPGREGGTAILLHRFQRRFPPRRSSRTARSSPTPRTARDREALAEAERSPRPTTRARSRSTAPAAPCHPLLPFADWGAMRRPRSAGSARARRRLPRRGRRAAARLRPGARRRRRAGRWRAGRGARRVSAILLSPPYFPLDGPASRTSLRSRRGRSCGLARSRAALFASSESTTRPVSST